MDTIVDCRTTYIVRWVLNGNELKGNERSLTDTC